MKHPYQLLIAISIVATLIVSCTSSSSQLAERNKQLCGQGIDAVNARNWDALDSLIAPNYVRHCPATPGVEVNSLEAFKAYLKQDAAAFPDSRITIDRMVAEGNMVAYYGTYVGTQKGQMGPFPPSNKQMTLEFASVNRIENGKLVESWITWDNMSALTQLGHFPAMPQSSQ